MGPRLRISLSPARDTAGTRLALAGELDFSVMQDVEDRVPKSPGEALVLDMSELTFIDSSGLRFVIQLNEAAARGGWALQLVPGPPEVQRVFKLVDLEHRLPFVNVAPAAATDPAA